MTAETTTFSMIVCQILLSDANDAGINQSELLRRSEISTATWNRINRGLSSLGIEDLHSAAGVVGKNLDDIMRRAAKVETELPNLSVDVVSLSKQPRGRAAQQNPTKGTDTGNLMLSIIAIGGLAYLVGRILKQK